MLFRFYTRTNITVTNIFVKGYGVTVTIFSSHILCQLFPAYRAGFVWSWPGFRPADLNGRIQNDPSSWQRADERQ